MGNNQNSRGFNFFAHDNGRAAQPGENKTKFIDGTFVADCVAEVIKDAIEIGGNSELTSDEKNEAINNKVLEACTKIIIGFHEKGYLK
jgi:hypothetical protein